MTEEEVELQALDYPCTAKKGDYTCTFRGRVWCVNCVVRNLAYDPGDFTDFQLKVMHDLIRAVR